MDIILFELLQIDPFFQINKIDGWQIATYTLIAIINAEGRIFQMGLKIVSVTYQN